MKRGWDRERTACVARSDARRRADAGPDLDRCAERPLHCFVRQGLPPLRLPTSFVFSLVFLDLLLGHMLAKELSHQLGDLVAVRFQSEVAGIEQVILQRLQVSLVRFGPGSRKDLVVLPPRD